MGRKLDLSGLSDNEAEHVLRVVQRDMRLRKKEEERLSELKQELDEESSRCLLLSRQSCFNQRCCIRCCSPFTFLLNPKHQCRDCRYNVCKACRVYNKREKAWLCSACQKSRLLKTQSLEWFYTNVKQRFKRFGSAKVLKTLYRKHLAEHSALSELTEGSACEESICNEGSICGSDSTFYRQTEEHSMAETLTVAMRVAEEAIDEAISKAEFDTSSQEKQNEAHYLREHRGELIEELAQTIVQKIISRRKTLAEMRAEYDHEWPLQHNTDLLHHHHHPSACDQASSSLKHQSNLWRSHSAFSLLDNDLPGLIQESSHTLKKEGGVSAVTAWKSVDRLDNAGVSSVLKSPDGNWIALQSAQLSRPSLLTKRKSLVYSALERESGVVSAYEGLGSDNETKPEPDSSWGAALQEIHRKMTDSNFNFYDTGDKSPSLLAGRRGSRDGLSDSEGNWKSNKPLLALLKRKVPAEIRRPSSSRRTSITNVNFILEGAGGEEEMKVAVEPEVGKVRRSRKKRRSRKETTASSSVTDLDKKVHDSLHPPDASAPDTLTSGATTPEPFDAMKMNEEVTLNIQQLAGRLSDSSTKVEGLNEEEDVGDVRERQEDRRGSEDGVEEEESLWKMEVDLEGGRTEDEEDKEADDEEMRYRLYRLVAQSRLTYFSSTDDELDRAGQSEGEWDRDEDMEEDKKQEEDEADGLAYQLCQLEKEVRATQFSSTEDELDRIGGREEEGKDEELAVKVCRLANQINATQFSSTEDELDRAGKEGEEAMDEEPLWKLQAEKAVQAAPLRHLASLVSASQFSSTEDELDRVDERDNEGETKHEDDEETESSVEMEELWGGAEGRRESIGEIDEKMFDLRNDDEERKKESDLNSQTKAEDVQQDETLEQRGAQDDVTEKRNLCGKQVLKGDEEEKEPEEQQETELKTIEAEQITTVHESQPEAKREEEFQEPKDSRGRWETVTDSEEEDVEFNRIISSMLMMTLEDMQVENKAAERDRETEEEETCTNEEESETVTVQSTEETGSVSHEFHDKRPEAASGEGAKEETSGKQESEENSAINITETTVARRTHARTDTDEEEQGGRGQKTADKETCGDAADCEKESVEETKEEHVDETEQSSSASPHEGFLSPEDIQNDRDMELYNTIEFISTLLEQRYSAVSLRSITTEVLKVLNATEELLQGVEGDVTQLSTTSLPPNTDPKKLDQQFSRLEENVYMTAGSVYSLEAELSDLEVCARGICSSTSDMELSFLEEQVAAAAAKVQQSELQISDISARIAALKTAGLNVDPQSRFSKSRTIPVMPATLDSSRQQRRRLPAPPVKEDKET